MERGNFGSKLKSVRSFIWTTLLTGVIHALKYLNGCDWYFNWSHHYIVKLKYDIKEIISHHMRWNNIIWWLLKITVRSTKTWKLGRIANLAEYVPHLVEEMISVIFISFNITDFFTSLTEPIITRSFIVDLSQKDDQTIQNS